LDSLNNVFIKNSREAIWQLQSVGGLSSSSSPINTFDGYYFIIPPTGFNGVQSFYINNALVASFEAGDKRKTSWMKVYTTTVAPITNFYYPYKYKLNNTGTSGTTPPSPASNEYLMVLRLAEQYLIRAEARAQQGNILGAQSDLNIIRARAWLAPTVANNKNSLLTDIAHERQVELFTEWGHRWLDLKRTGAVDVVMSIQTPLKGGVWNSYQQLYPILLNDIVADPNLKQNGGY